jgi:alcohol dehydrogenase class IV
MPEVFYGTDAAETLDALDAQLRQADAKRVFLVTGPHVSKTDGFQTLKAIVARDDRQLQVYSDTKADPSLCQVDEMAAQARDFQADTVIGIGGGSPLDASKVVAALLTNSGSAADFVGQNLIPKRCATLFHVPTSSGTGSEVTEYAVLTNTETQMKGAVCSSNIIPHAAFLIPEMTFSMPPQVTAATGLDAFCHAAEAYLSKKRNLYSDVMALQALRLIRQHLLTAYQEPTNETARGQMLLASLIAGLAFGNSSVTAVHAFAYPLGGMHHVPHGSANSLMFAPIFRHNLVGNEERFADLAEAFCGVRKPDALVPAVQELKQALNLPMSLREAGIPEDDLEAMSQSVMGVTRLLGVNPNPIALDDARRIYREAYDGV